MSSVTNRKPLANELNNVNQDVVQWDAKAYRVVSVGSVVGDVDTLIDDSTSNTIYVGKAVPGTGTDEALWQIKKINTSSGVVVSWADGDSDFDNVWDDRGSLVYNSY